MGKERWLLGVDRLDEFPENYVRVLLHIAIGGPKTKYQIEKETKLNHATIHEAIRVLLAHKQIRGKVVGTTRVGLPKTEYGLTPRGLFEAIEVAKAEYTEKIVQKWKHIEPILVGKWDYLVKKVGIRKVRKLFRDAARYSDFDWLWTDENVEEFIDTIVLLLFGPASEVDDEDLEKWIRAFRGNTKLREYAEDYIIDQLKFAKDVMEHAKFLKKKFSIRGFFPYDT